MADKPILNLDHYKHDCVFYHEQCASDSEDYYAGQGDYHCWCECAKHKMQQVPGTESHTYWSGWCPMYCKTYRDDVCPTCLIKLTPHYVGLTQEHCWTYELRCLTVGCPNWDKVIVDERR